MAPASHADRGESRGAVTVNEEPAQDVAALERAAEREAERIMRHLTQDPELGEEWLRQDNRIYGGLVAIGIVFVQALLPYSLNASAMTCVLAFAVAIPLLAALTTQRPAVPTVRNPHRPARAPARGRPPRLMAP